MSKRAGRTHGSVPTLVVCPRHAPVHRGIAMSCAAVASPQREVPEVQSETFGSYHPIATEELLSVCWHAPRRALQGVPTVFGQKTTLRAQRGGI
jgi:hypothetical protein